MKEREKEFYRNLLRRREEDDARRFGWTNEHTQSVRFIQLIKLVRQICEAKQCDPADMAILDFGCGDGRLFSIMKQMGVGAEYYGIDGIEEHIDTAVARAKVDDVNALYQCFAWNGLDKLPFIENADFIVESGAFSTTPPDRRSLMLKQFFEYPKVGFAGNFVTNSKIIKGVNPNLNLIYPEDIVEIIDITQYAFVVWADYLEADFSIGVYKR